MDNVTLEELALIGWEATTKPRMRLSDDGAFALAVARRVLVDACRSFCNDCDTAAQDNEPHADGPCEAYQLRDIIARLEREAEA